MSDKVVYDIRKNNEFLLKINGGLLGFSIVSLAFDDTAALVGLSAVQALLVFSSLFLVIALLFDLKPTANKVISYIAYSIEIITFIIAFIFLVIATVV